MRLPAESKALVAKSTEALSGISAASPRLERKDRPSMSTGLDPQLNIATLSLIAGLARGSDSRSSSWNGILGNKLKISSRTDFCRLLRLCTKHTSSRPLDRRCYLHETNTTWTATDCHAPQPNTCRSASRRTSHAERAAVTSSQGARKVRKSLWLDGVISVDGRSNLLILH